MPIGATALLSSIGAGIGGVCGYAIGGPDSIVDGAKIGLGLGIQVGNVYKDESVAKEDKRSAIKRIIDKNKREKEIKNGAMNGLGIAQEKLVNTVERVTHTWSTLMLSGYAVKIVMNGVSQNMSNYNEFRDSTLDSINCVSMSLTTVSLNMIAVSTCACIGLNIIKMLNERKTNV